MVPAPTPITVVLADPNEVSRAGLRALLNGDARIRVVGEAAGDLVAAAHRMQPSLIVLDPARGKGLDLAIVDALHGAAPGSPIVIQTGHFEPHAFMAAMLKRVHGYFPKGVAPDGRRLLDALVPIAQSCVVSVGPTIAAHFWSLPGTPIAVHDPADLAGRLTRRELDLLLLALAGRTDDEIAQELHIGRVTAETHVRHVMQKLDARTRTHLGVIAARAGLA